MPLILPDEKRKKFLRSLYKHLHEFKENESADDLLEAVQKMLQDKSFIPVASALFPRGINSPEDAERLTHAYMHTLLAKRDYVSAALILWGPDVFTPEPRCAQLIFEALFNHQRINLLGCGSVGKSFTAAAWALLDWCMDPEWTRVQLASSTEDHCKKNLFANVVRLHNDASIKLPGVVDTESISMDKKRGYGIYILTVPTGPKSKSKVKGLKVANRSDVHPILGKMARMRFILDEAQEIAPNIFEDVDNLLSTGSVENSVEAIKVYCAANPKDEWSIFGQNCKPDGGFDKLGPMQETWTSSRGWHCVRINAMTTENVVMRKEIYSGLITYDGVQKILKSCDNDDQHPRMYTLVYGMFPPQGNMSAIIRSQHLRQAEGEWVFNGFTTPYASFDPAFTGDLPALATGRVGKAVAWEDYSGVRHELPEPRVAAQIDAIGILPRGDTQDLADSVMSRLKQLGVKPEHFSIDRTGPGLGVHDVIRRQWNDKVAPVDGIASIYGINYAQSASEVKVTEEDTEVPKKLYKNIASELWFAAGKLYEYDYVRIGKNVDPVVFEELSARRGGSKVGDGKLQAVEGKDVYKARTGKPSPDRADAANMLLQNMRCTQPELIPKAKDTTKDVVDKINNLPAWSGFDLAFAGAKLQGFDGPELPDMHQD